MNEQQIDRDQIGALDQAASASSRRTREQAKETAGLTDPRTHQGGRMTNLTTLAAEIFQANKEKGFWDEPRGLCETTMLIVTELAEAVEEERAGKPDVYYRPSRLDEDLLPEYGPELVRIDRATSLVRPDWAMDSDGVPPLKPEGVDVELIDALIRLLDLLGSRGTDIDELLAQKLAFNQTRGVRHNKSY